PASSTGRCRKPPWIITTPACCVLSSASTVSGWRVIHGDTSPPMSPDAAARSTSRSVTMPIRRSPSMTSTAPTRLFVIDAAASTSGVDSSTVSRLRDITSPTTAISVAELRATPVDVGLQLVLQPLVQLRLLVLVERPLRDLRCARRGVFPAVAVPALVVLGRGEQGPVEALAKPLERVHRAEEVPTLANLLVRAVGQRLLVDLHRLEHVVEHAQQLHVDD